MRIALFFHEPPFPAIHGGRVDVLRRVKAFAALGIEVDVYCWAKPADNLKDRDISIFDLPTRQLRVFVEGRNIFAFARRVILLARFPWDVTSRLLSKSRFYDAQRLLEETRPDLIWAESLYAGVTASRLASALNTPFIYRSHNIEHIYMAQQGRLQINVFKRAKAFLSVLHLKSIERSMIKRANVFFDISLDDLEFWRREGAANGHWLPPNMDPEVEQSWAEISMLDSDVDVIFFGNLNTPNNVSGVLWFLEEILPQLRRLKPDMRVVIAGSNPSASISEIAERCRVELWANPDNVVNVLKRARVLINPVRSGSGVNVKAVEMLFSKAALVSTSIGVKGLPIEVKKAFHLADTAKAFEECIMAALKSGRTAEEDDVRRIARSHFSVGAVASAIQLLREKFSREF